MTAKPLNVQFELTDEKEIDETMALANKIAKLRSDRRLGAGGVVKEIFLRALKSGLAEKLLEFHEDERGLVAAEDAEKYEPARPKGRRERQPVHQVATKK